MRICAAVCVFVRLKVGYASPICVLFYCKISLRVHTRIYI